MDPSTAIIAVAAGLREADTRVAGQNGAVGVAMAVPVSIDIPDATACRIRTIDFTAAVIVDAITDFFGIGMDPSTVIIAVAACLREARTWVATLDGPLVDAKAVEVGIGVPDPHADGSQFIDAAVAIVVDEIAVFHCPWMAGRAQVIAVICAGGVAIGSLAGGEGVVGRAMAIAIVVDVVDPSADSAWIQVIHQLVAVVVDEIADFICVRMNLGVAIVAVKDPVFGVDIALWLTAGVPRKVLVAEAVPVRVRVKTRASREVEVVIFIVHI